MTREERAKDYAEHNIYKYTTDFANLYNAYLKGAMEETKELEKENAELKARLKYYSEQICNKECAEVWGELTEAKEIIEKLLNALASNDFFEEEELCAMAEAEQFLEEALDNDR